MMYGWSGWGMWLIGPVMLILVIWLVAWLVRDSAGTRAATNPAEPHQILDERFARGEIDRDEYQARLAALRKS